jgi:hypothetical protein
LQTRLDKIFESETKNFEEAKKLKERKEREEANKLGATAGGLPTMEPKKKKKNNKEKKSVTWNLVSEDSALPKEWALCACRNAECLGCPYEEWPPCGCGRVGCLGCPDEEWPICACGEFKWFGCQYE